MNTVTARYTTQDRVRFTAKVEFPADNDGCWLWQGAKHGQGRGYGKIRLGGKVVSAHKAGYLLFVGPVEEGKVLGHQCNNESCCNPSHLKAESQSENMTYCVMSGRHNSQSH
jgi:hypothetical protein